MKKTNLSRLIQARLNGRLNRHAVIGESKNLLFSDLVQFSLSLQDKRVILYISDTASLISAMTSLDGFVKLLSPISTLMRKNVLIYLLSLYKFDVVVSDMPADELQAFRDQNIKVFTIDDLNFSKEDQQKNSSEDTMWLIPTSGTTSKPKLVKHTLSSLTASALRTKNEHDETQVCALFYDPTRYAGYQTIFFSLLNGHKLLTPMLSETINERVKKCIEERVTHISATPTLWRKILMSSMSTRIPLKQIVLGGESVDQRTLDALRKQFPNSKITHVYASTEAGLGLSVSDGLAGFPLKFLENSVSPVQIAFRKNRLFLRSQSVALGYCDDADLKDLDGWVDTGDLVKIEGQRFFVIGRANGTINIGGDKVNPNKVRQILLEHPHVIEARVYGKKNPISGTLLAADVMLDYNVDEVTGKESVLAYIKERLHLKERPRIVRIVDNINVDSTGKISQR